MKKFCSLITSVLILISYFSFLNPTRWSASAASVQMYGDLNKDGKINISDLIVIKSYYLNGNNTELADICVDGEITSADIYQLYRYLFGVTQSVLCDTSKDSDNDGLPDYAESDLFNTDINNDDTDNDGINDYQEIMISCTDPLEPDLSYLTQDSDNDKLINSEELEYSTDPNNSDTDEDGLSDYLEVKKYKTNPNNSDSDGDNLTDWEEVMIETNPLKSKTDDKIIDSEIIKEHEINDSDKNKFLSEIKTDSYKFSVKIKAPGYYEKHLKVQNSGYTYSHKNEYILGNMIDIEYSDFKVQECTVIFQVYENPERYCICKYFDEVNEFLPVETTYDGNKLSYTDNQVGSYCLINASHWVAEAETEEVLGYNSDNKAYATGDEENKDKIDIYFIKYFPNNSSYDIDKTIVEQGAEKYLETVDSKYKPLRYHEKPVDLLASYMSRILYMGSSLSKDIRIYGINEEGTVLLRNGDDNSKVPLYADNNSDYGHIYRIASSGGVNFFEYEQDVNNYNGSGESSDKIRTLIRKPWSLCGALWNGSKLSLYGYNSEAFSNLINSDNDRKKYVVVLDNGCSPSCDNAEDAVNELKKKGVDFSFYFDPMNPNAKRYVELSTNYHAYIWSKEAPYDNLIKEIFGLEEIDDENCVYGLFGKKYRLKKHLSIEDVKKYLSDKRSVSSDFIADSDNDGISDFDEIKTVSTPAKKMHELAGSDEWFREEYLNGQKTGTVIDIECIYWLTSPELNDSDGDGLLDGYGYNKWGLEIKDPEPDKANNFIPFGTDSYFDELDGENVNSKYLMNQVNNAEYYDLIPFEYWNRFCDYFNTKVVFIDKELHYFRCKLNRAPNTLTELLFEKDKWKLLGADESIYHMFDSPACFDEKEGIYKGEYNLKFVSKDGKFEAVYNFKGELLDEKNDPMNMGTYNYSNPVIFNIIYNPGHLMKDMVPYSDEWYTLFGTWGGWYNTPDCYIDCSKAPENKEKYKNNPKVELYRGMIKDKMVS